MEAMRWPVPRLYRLGLYRLLRCPVPGLLPLTVGTWQLVVISTESGRHHTWWLNHAMSAIYSPTGTLPRASASGPNRGVVASAPGLSVDVRPGVGVTRAEPKPSAEALVGVGRCVSVEQNPECLQGNGQGPR
jgi:hypothetical protein